MAMKFILICLPSEQLGGSLIKAAKKYDVEVIVVNSNESLSKLNPKERYFFYSTRTPSSSPSYMDLEEYITNNFSLIKLGERSRNSDVHLLDSFKLAGLPLPKTIRLFERDPDTIKQTVEKLGGYPVIVRAPGKRMQGKGIIKMDSEIALNYLLAYLPENRPITLQEYVPHSFSARIIVLGDEIIASYCNPVSNEEFRSNIHRERNRFEKKFPPEIEKVAIDAARIRFAKFAGVDILFNEKMEHYLTEVNFPCNFLPPEKHFNIPVAEKIIEYFLMQEKKINSSIKLTQNPKEKLALIIDDKNPEIEELDSDLHAIEIAAKTHNISTKLVINDFYDINNNEQLEQNVKYKFYPFPINEAQLLSSIQEISDLPTQIIYYDERDKLPKYVEKIGGYPLLIKTFDQSPNPFLYADSYHSLVSLCDYCWIKANYVELQPYIKIKQYGGLVVLANEVIASVRFLPKKSDQILVEGIYTLMQTEFSKEIEKLALTKVKKLGLSFALVEFIIDQDEQCCITKVSPKFQFSPIQRVTGIDIADKIIRNLYQ